MKELQQNIENSYVQLMRLREVMRIMMEHKLTIRRTDDIKRGNYIDSKMICVWCRISLYIGHQYKDVPEDLNAYFIAPQQYSEYMQICKDFIEGSLR